MENSTSNKMICTLVDKCKRQRSHLSDGYDCIHSIPHLSDESCNEPCWGSSANESACISVTLMRKLKLQKIGKGKSYLPKV